MSNWKYTTDDRTTFSLIGDNLFAVIGGELMPAIPAIQAILRRNRAEWGIRPDADLREFAAILAQDVAAALLAEAEG